MDYITVSGDTWDSIAFKFYGDTKKLNHIMSANKQHIRTVIFSGGVTLKIPELAVEETEEFNRPPWRL